jgi:hypothetical protein
VTDFQTASAVLGGLLMFGAVVSGLVQRSFLALTPLFVVIGFVLSTGGVDGFGSSPLLFNLAALVVVLSTIAHGLSDKPGVDWIARRSGT